MKIVMVLFLGFFFSISHLCADTIRGEAAFIPEKGETVEKIKSSLVDSAFVSALSKDLEMQNMSATDFFKNNPSTSQQVKKLIKSYSVVSFSKVEQPAIQYSMIVDFMIDRQSLVRLTRLPEKSSSTSLYKNLRLFLSVELVGITWSDLGLTKEDELVAPLVDNLKTLYSAKPSLVYETVEVASLDKSIEEKTLELKLGVTLKAEEASQVLKTYKIRFEIEKRFVSAQNQNVLLQSEVPAVTLSYNISDIAALRSAIASRIYSLFSNSFEEDLKLVIEKSNEQQVQLQVENQGSLLNLMNFVNLLNAEGAIFTLQASLESSMSNQATLLLKYKGDPVQFRAYLKKFHDRSMNDGTKIQINNLEQPEKIVLSVK